MKVVRMLNVLYTTFDVLTDPRKNPNIYKVLIYHVFRLFRVKLRADHKKGKQKMYIS